MGKRLGLWLVRFALWFDKSSCFLPRWIVSFFTYVILNRSGLPRTDRSWSGWVGECALQNQGWALVAQKLVNFIMMNPNHCGNAVGHDSND